jgi:hypothetical protein
MPLRYPDGHGQQAQSRFMSLIFSLTAQPIEQGMVQWRKPASSADLYVEEADRSGVDREAGICPAAAHVLRELPLGGVKDRWVDNRARKRGIAKTGVF